MKHRIGLCNAKSRGGGGVHLDTIRWTEWRNRAVAELKISETTFKKASKAVVNGGFVVKVGDGRSAAYQLTKEGRQLSDEHL